MEQNSKVKNLIGWLEYRLPIFAFGKKLGQYPVPKNLNYMWNFGSLAAMALFVQIISGLFLAVHYSPSSLNAFSSIEKIMREINYGWLIRYMHIVGSSSFFIVIYIHIFRSLFYGSYKNPRELIWLIGMVIFMLMIATAFMGHILPFGQMSFWSATVIANLLANTPIIGDTMKLLLFGGTEISDHTLQRMFVFHYLLPLIIVFVVIIHLLALRQHGSNNPCGVEPKNKQDILPFHPYYTTKDCFCCGVYCLVFSFFVFFYPNYFINFENYFEADPALSPDNIVPEWYFMPFYSILRSMPSKLTGIIAMFMSITLLFLLPWLDRSKVRSGCYRPWFKFFYFLFAINCIVLGYLATKPAEDSYIFWGRIFSCYYFVYFLLILPLLTRFEKTLPIPAEF